MFVINAMQTQRSVPVWLNEEQLKQFKRVGKNVLISDKAVFYGADKIEIGDHVRIDDFCLLSSYGGFIKIGKRVHIAAGVKIYGSAGVEIGDYANISCNCTIFSASDDFSGEYLIGPTVPLTTRCVKARTIYIGPYSVMAAHCVLFPGAVLAAGVALGACAMLSKHTDPWKVYVGVPAKYLHDRKIDLLQLAEDLDKKEK